MFHNAQEVDINYNVKYIGKTVVLRCGMDAKENGEVHEEIF